MASAKRKRTGTGLNATPNAAGRVGFVPQSPQTPLVATPLTDSATHPSKRKKLGSESSSKKKRNHRETREESEELPYVSSPVSAKRNPASADGHHAPPPVPETPQPEIPIDPAITGETMSVRKDQDQPMEDADQTGTRVSTPWSKDTTRESSALNSTKKGRRDYEETNGKKGFFEADEIEKLEAFKLEFCTTHGQVADVFDSMVQHSDRDRQDWPVHNDIITKSEFWKRVYETLPNRDKRSIYRFMRRHFQCSSQKPHQWTHEQDEELVSLHRLHGARWAYIARMLGRSDDDVVQRWKNRLQHRRTMNHGSWKEEEVRALLEAVQAAWHAMKAAGENVGRDIYEMDEFSIAWGPISDRMNNCRSRQQCADKWRKLRFKVMAQRSMGNPDAFFDPATTKPRRHRYNKSQEKSTPKNQTFKSNEFVGSEDEDANQEPRTTEKEKHAQEDEVEEEEEEEEEESEDESAEPTVPIKHERHSPEPDDADLPPPSKQPSGAVRHITTTDSREDSVAESSTDEAESDDEPADPVIKQEYAAESESEPEESPSPHSKRDIKPNLNLLDDEAATESESEDDDEEEGEEEENYATPPSGRKAGLPGSKVTSPSATKSSHQQQDNKPRSPLTTIKTRKSPSPTASVSSSSSEAEDDEEEGGSETSSTGGDWPAKPPTQTTPLQPPPSSSSNNTNTRKPTGSTTTTTTKRNITSMHQQAPTRTTRSTRSNPAPEPEEDDTSSSDEEEEEAASAQTKQEQQPRRPTFPTRPSFGSSSQPSQPLSQRASLKELKAASLRQANSKLKTPSANTLIDIVADAKKRAQEESSSSSEDEDDEDDDE
ncbi:MYB DNA-binding domain protein [Aspergillus homomorphus CBS 101889]|uniref:Uncharacterized protein n=1 Tax=Aspergillus homomorphus (strain CBS 101889) TaxID=1450537 RepID=A0A395HSK0_ASPHC|nr:hypothetical protein BO97DRAFT_141060 [Aspergillus homomorphus CBS 101889]RAL10315.1 hypothetical protein BO97DRAFT_141060 [Aspergillus homomorphus CBS 101889]